MKKIILNELEYELLENYKEGYDSEETLNKCTDYFINYDYIVGDWAYGKLRLKGFCDKINEIYNYRNDFHFYKEYIKNDCAYDCKYFVLKKVEGQEKK